MTVGTMGTPRAPPTRPSTATRRSAGRRFAGILLGEISPGGDGGGLYGSSCSRCWPVFIAGLMVGRTPEFLGKKIRAPQMKLVVAYVLTIPTVVLVLRQHGPSSSGRAPGPSSTPVSTA